MDSDRSVVITLYNLWIFFFVTFTVWYLRYLWDNRRFYWLAYKIPGPVIVPIVGNFFILINVVYKDVLKVIISLMDTYPRLCKVWALERLCVLISDPKLIDTVLNSPQTLDKNEFYATFSEAFGDGILTAKAKVWKSHRKMIAPSFNQKILESFVDIFVEKSRNFSRKIEECVDVKGLNWYEYATQCTLDIVCRTALGVDADSQIDSDKSIGEHIDKFLEAGNKRIFNFFLNFPFIWRFSRTKREFETCTKLFQSICMTIIQNKMLECREKKKLEFEEDFTYIEDGLKKNKRALLDFIMDSSDINETELTAEVLTFLGAGTETSAATLCAIFTVLGMFQDIQDKVHNELLDIMGPDRDVLPSDLPQLKYTERVIKETLRIFPTAPGFARTVTSDLDLGGVIIPEGSSVAILPLYMHRSPKYWKNPLEFDPDRFLPEEVAARHPCVYLPFSYGPRNCIGGKYAVMNIKTIMATVLRQFRVRTEYKSIEEIELKMQILLRFKDGYKIWFERR